MEKEMTNKQRFAEARANRQQQSTIEADRLENTERISIPDAPNADIADRFIRDTSIPSEDDKINPTDPLQNEEIRDLAKSINQRGEILEELGLGDIKSTFSDLMKRGSFTLDQENQQGIGQKTRDLNDINNQIRERDLEFRRNRERLEDEAGLTASQKQVQLNDLKRNQARELADLSVIQSARNNDLATAQALVNRRVELEFEPIQQKLEFQKVLFDENKSLFNQQEQRQFEKKTQERQEQIDKDKFKFRQLEETKMELLKAAQFNNAPIEIIRSVLSSKDAEKAIIAAGEFGEDPNKKLDFAIRKQKISLNNLAIEQAEKDLLSSEVVEGIQKTGKENFKVAGFAHRMKDSSVIINAFEDNIISQGRKVPSVKDIARFRSKGIIPNEFNTEDARQYFQAKEDFITASLRLESGAVISDDEFIRENNKLFAQSGDGQATLDQRKNTRNNIMLATQNESKGGFEYIDYVKSIPSVQRSSIISTYADEKIPLEKMQNNANSNISNINL